MHKPPQARINSYYSQKRNLVGHHGKQPAPAWRVGNPANGTHVGIGSGGSSGPQEQSRILVSHLPIDVALEEIDDLFRKTVGPLKDAAILYNSQGTSKGMAVVTFQRPNDAGIARAKYNGQVVDGRRPIKIELVIDGDPSATTISHPTAPSLLNRLGVKPITVTTPNQPNSKNKPNQPKSIIQRVEPISVPVRTRIKKGPRRVRKAFAAKKTAEELDREMEDYRSAAQNSKL